MINRYRNSPSLIRFVILACSKRTGYGVHTMHVQNYGAINPGLADVPGGSASPIRTVMFTTNTMVSVVVDLDER